MANAIVVIKIMPESPDVDLEKVHEEAIKKIVAYAGEGETRKEIEPIAFGIKALKITFVVDEAKGTDDIQEQLKEIEGVQSAEVIDFRRAIG